jgi:hypothetical protein
VLGLVLRELEEEALRHGKYGEPQALDMRQDLDLLLVAEDPLLNIDDLAKIYDAEELLRPRTLRVLKHGSPWFGFVTTYFLSNR